MRCEDQPTNGKDTKTMDNGTRMDRFDALMTAWLAWDEARRAERRAAADLREAIRGAREAGYTRARIGVELGVSRQRVDPLSR